MDSIWRNGRLQRVENWFDRIRARASFEEAFSRWMPQALAAEMQANGRDAWPEIESMLDLG
jgi:hypothetical protein